MEKKASLLNVCVSGTVVFSMLSQMLIPSGSAQAWMSQGVKQQISLQQKPPSSIENVPMGYRLFLPTIFRSPETASMVVQPGLGGTLSIMGGKIQVGIAPHITESLRIVLQAATFPNNLPVNLASGGPAFTLQAYDAQTGELVESLPPFVTWVEVEPDMMPVPVVTPTVVITVNYTAPDVWGINLSTLRLYQETPEGWLPADGSYTSQSTSQVLGEVETLGKFMPLGRLASSMSFSPMSVMTTTAKLALDPDDNVGYATWNGRTVRELTYNLMLAEQIRQRFQANQCQIDILITRGSANFVSRTSRVNAANNFGAETFTTLAFNALRGTPWGVERDGGVRTWARGGTGADVALANSVQGNIQTYTGRPSTRPVSLGPIYGEIYNLTAGRYTHIETLFLDHNFDWPVIDTQFSLAVDAVYAALATELGNAGLRCGPNNEPPPLPAPPSAEVLKRLRDLGYQNYQRYGADPVSFSTGNHILTVNLAGVPGRGGLDVDFDLTYNAQDGRCDIVGCNWTFAYNIRAQKYSDNSVSVVLADGRTYHYTWNGSSYVAPAGVYDRLEQTAEGVRWVSQDLETVLTFAQRQGGFLTLETWQDRAGNTLSFQHDLSGEDDWEDGNPVPRPPLTAIVDTAGRTFTIENTNGRISAIHFPDGRNILLSYNTTGDLMQITNANGGQHNFAYDARHRVTLQWDPEGYLFLRNTYDDRDRVIEQVDASGTRLFIAYDPVNGVTTYTDNGGHVYRYYHDALNRVTREQDALGNSTYTVYDDNYNVIQTQDKRGFITRYVYDERGNLIERHDPIDNYSGVYYQTDITRWAYNSANQPISMTNALGHTYLYQYDVAGNLTHGTAPNGATTTATYNAWGQPLSVTDALMRTTTYQYNSAGQLLRTTYPDGSFSTSTYDAAGRELTFTDANGHTVTFGYDPNDNLTRITDPRGAHADFFYDQNDLLTSSVDRRGAERLYQYDENLKLVAERDPEQRWSRYGFDNLYRRTTMTDTLGAMTRLSYDALGQVVSMFDPLNHETRYIYDADGNVIMSIDALGNRTSMVYDAVGRLKFLIDANGARTEFCYDAEDQLIRTIGPRGEVTDYTYDAVGQLVAFKNPLGFVTRFEYDLVGNQTATVDALNRRTDITYDLLDRPVKIEAPTLLNGQRATTLMAYDNVGNTVAMTNALGFATYFFYDANDNLERMMDALGHETRYVYDAEDNPVTVTDARGNTYTTTYNLLGMPTQVQDALGYNTHYIYDDGYNLARIINAQGQPTDYTYDLRGALLSVTDPLSQVTAHYTRDALGRVVLSTDANGQPTAYAYDPVGRLIAVTDALSQTTRYGYDLVGNLTLITDTLGRPTRFEYNFLNQLAREVNANNHQWSYAYDPVGNMTRRVDAMWQATYYDYDALNRLAQVRYGTTPPGQQPVTFTYDLLGNELMMCDALGCNTHVYDALNQRVATTDWLGRMLTRTFDAVGNLTGLSYPNGQTVHYAYNANNWLSTLTNPAGQVTTYQHNAVGQVEFVWRPNGTRTAFTYDTAGRLTNLDNRPLMASAPHSAYAYTLDAAGNRLTTLETRAAFDGSPVTVALNHVYAYDHLNRLARAQTVAPDSDTAYTFDGVGNRLSKSGTVLAPDSGVPQLPVSPRPEVVSYTYGLINELLVAGDTAFGYNPNGNRISQTETLTNGQVLLTSYVFDREDRLTQVTKAMSDTWAITVTMVATYTYDGYGRRAIKEVTNYTNALTVTEVITYLYEGLDIIGAQLNLDGVVTETYYYLAPSPITGLYRPVEMERLPNPATGFAGDRHWYNTDGLDSIVGLTTLSGELVSPFLYEEYGQVLAGSADLQLFTYTAQDYDAETGLLHFYARYYDPVVGVWVTQDIYRGALLNPLSMNRYVYVEGNPLFNVDFYGYFIHIAAGAIVGGIVAGATSVATQLWNTGGKGVDLNEVIASTAGGFATGGICAATAGLGCVIGGGSVGGTVTQMFREGLGTGDQPGKGLNFSKYDWGSVAIEGGIGGITGFATWGGGKILGGTISRLRANNGLGKSLIGSFDDIGKEMVRSANSLKDFKNLALNLPRLLKYGTKNFGRSANDMSVKRAWRFFYNETTKARDQYRNLNGITGREIEAGHLIPIGWLKYINQKGNKTLLGILNGRWNMTPMRRGLNRSILDYVIPSSKVAFLNGARRSLLPGITRGLISKIPPYSMYQTNTSTQNSRISLSVFTQMLLARTMLNGKAR